MVQFIIAALSLQNERVLKEIVEAVNISKPVYSCEEVNSFADIKTSNQFEFTLSKIYEFQI